MLDVIGATVIGAVFILAMVTAVYNVQVITHNSNMMLTNTEITDRIITAMDSLYIPKAGLGVTDGNAIKYASDRSFLFKGMVEGSIVDTILIIRDGTPGNFTLSIYKEGPPNSFSRQLGPFALTDDDRNLKFTYYKYADNGSGLEPTVITGSADWQSIRLVQLDIDLQQTMVRNDIDARNLHNHVRTWIYLKSLFITQGP
jgi:hypothetical protein